jgi:hypothetical protein
MYRESRDPVTTDVSPKDAEKFLALNNFPGQRKYNPLIGRQYAMNMQQGTHRRIEIAVAKVRENNTDYLMNGQHNCEGVRIYGKPWKATVSYYLCDTMVDAWALFATFDVHRARSEQQFMKGRRGLFSDERLHDVPLAVLSACGTALLALSKDPDRPSFEIRSTSKTFKADLVEKFPDEVLFVSAFSEARHLILVGTAAAMITTWRKNPGAAEEFWMNVASGEMLASRDPEYKLREALIRKDFYAAERCGTARNAAIYSMCIMWWNAKQSGEARRTVKLASMKSIPRLYDGGSAKKAARAC